MSCSIADSRNSYVYITGGFNRFDPSIHRSLRFVTRYSPDGSSKDLPDLNIGRNRHACSGYYNQRDHFVLLVVGGSTSIREDPCKVWVIRVWSFIQFLFRLRSSVLYGAVWGGKLLSVENPHQLHSTIGIDGTLCCYYRQQDIRDRWCQFATK